MARRKIAEVRVTMVIKMDCEDVALRAAQAAQAMVDALPQSGTVDDKMAGQFTWMALSTEAKVVDMRSESYLRLKWPLSKKVFNLLAQDDVAHLADCELEMHDWLDEKLRTGALNFNDCEGGN